MTPYYIIFVILVILSFAVFRSKDEKAKAIEACEVPDVASKLIAWRRGVWGGKNIEIVRTNKVQILFKRDASSPEGLWSEFSLVNYSGSEIEEDVRGIVYVNSKEKTFKAYVRDLWSQEKEEPYIFDAELSERAIGGTFKITSYGDGKIVLQADGGEMEVVSATGQIERLDKSGSMLYTLTRIEEFNLKDKGTPPKRLSESTIAQCLRSWMLGTGLVKDDDGTCNGIVIGTNHHMYIFHVKGKDSCYCRAGRYETCDKGIVFAQNIRLWVNAGTQEFVSFMSEDNEKMVIDESLFDPNACYYTTGGIDAEIYWSVKSASDDLIELHGCDGQTYRWGRPTPETAPVEWLY